MFMGGFFRETGKICRLWTTEQLIKFWTVRIMDGVRVSVSAPANRR